MGSKRKVTVSRSKRNPELSSRDESPPAPKRLTAFEIESDPAFADLDLVDTLCAKHIRLVERVEKFYVVYETAISTANNEKESLQLELKRTKAEMASISLKYSKAKKQLANIKKRTNLGKGNLYNKLVRGKETGSGRKRIRLERKIAPPTFAEEKCACT